MTTNVNHNLSPMQAIRYKNRVKNDTLSEAGMGPYITAIQPYDV